jgi:SNF2 family DNA or RNA helicase
MVTGTVEPAQRAQNVSDFQAGKIRILLITLGAGGEGLTLTAASIAIFLQRSFSAIKNTQAEDRIYGRVNDAHGAEIIDVISRDTVEDRIREVLLEKEEKLQEIVRDKENLRRWLEK